MGRRPLGSWSLLCSCPAPAGEGRRGRERRLRRGGLGRAGAWPWPRSGIRASSGFPARASSLGFLRRADLVLPSPFTALRASPATLAYLLVVVTWGADGNQPVELGLGLTLYSGPLGGRVSVFSWVSWGQEETRPRRVLVNLGRELVLDRSVKCQQVTFDETDPGTS